MAKLERTVDIEPLERLEEKVKLLVDAIDRLRTEKRHTEEENARLRIQVDSLTARAAEAEQAAGEAVALRSERDRVRSRVEEILEQLEAIEL
jgi:FtsZ-binding cell division protein ZapB